MARNPQFERLTLEQQTQIRHVIAKDFKAAKELFDYFLKQEHANNEEKHVVFPNTMLKD